MIETQPRRGKEISLELYTANERSELLAQVFGHTVVVVPAPVV